MNITAATEREFREQLKLFLQHPECIAIRNVVYSWKSARPIPRVSGESNILYIGQTRRSLNGRYGGTKDFEIEVAYFNRFYTHIIQKYGPICLEFEATDDPKFAEWQRLAEYYSKHLEYPPLNRSVPSKPATIAQ